MYSDYLQQVINNSTMKLQQNKGQNFLTKEHIIFEILESDYSFILEEILNGIKFKKSDFIKKLKDSLKERIEIEKKLYEKTKIEKDFNYENSIVVSKNLQKTLQKANFISTLNGREDANFFDFFFATFEEKGFFVKEHLDSINFEIQDLRNVLQSAQELIIKNRELKEKDENDNTITNNKERISISDLKNKKDILLDKIKNKKKEFENEDFNKEDSSFLKKYAKNLNKAAALGKITNVIGREIEIENIIKTLTRKKKNNPLLIGDAGVGKTSIVEGLAYNIVNDNVPDILKNKVIYSVDIGTMLAGTRYRGDFELRIKNLLTETALDPNVILFIDEIHTIIGAGSSSSGGADLSNLLKPALSSGELRCIGATTYEEFRKIFEKDIALTRRFKRVDIKEPSIEETKNILLKILPSYENFHGVTYDLDAVNLAVVLSDRFIHNKHMPDKAIDIIDEAGSYALYSENKKVDKSLIEKVISDIIGVPVSKINKNEKNQLKNLEKELKKSIFDQDEAIENLVDSVFMARSGISDKNKPSGSFLFTGPTGVGKTELTKKLGEILNLEVIRLDMSEYSDAISVSKLIGAPPGYVGYEEGGILTEAVNKNPHSIILFDEVEKAHPSLFNILLQVLDNGKLSDNTGRNIDFKHTTIILTSNLGTENIEKNTIGFTFDKNIENNNQDAIKDFFKPEFRNRLDAIVNFKHLSQTAIEKVVDKFITELKQNLKEKEIEISISHAAKKWLAENGYDKNMGARPMKRIIKEYISKPISKKIIINDFSNGNLKIGIKNNNIILNFNK